MAGVLRVKAALISPQVLSYPRTDLPYRLYTDASDSGVGAILVQCHEDGIEHVVQYYSQQLSDVQKRWSTIEKEAYSIISSVNKLRPYLLTIFTDHQPVTSQFSKKMLNTKLQRWALALIYHRGYDNVRADILSRPPKSMPSRAVTDVDNEWTDDVAFAQLPCLADGLDLENITAQQTGEFPNLFNTPDNEEDSPYIVMNTILYSTQRPTAYSATYPRLVLPSDHRENII